MNPQDLKRLIAGFLAFSVITSAVTLISLNFIGTTNTQQEALNVEGENPLSSISKNAFVEKLPSNGQQPDGSGAVISAYAGNGFDSSNLTKNLAGVFADQMVSKNPDGPQLDQDGNPTVLNIPGEDKTAEMIKQALSKSGITFDDKVSVPDYKIVKSFGPEDVSIYLQQVNGILSQVSSSTKSSLLANVQNPTIDDLTLPALAIDAALTKLSSLSVPQPFTQFHKTLLGLFANQKNVFNAVTDYQNDPMKTMLAVQNENEIIIRDVSRVKDAISKVDKNALSLNNSPEWEKLYSEIFGVKKAYAQLAVFDPAVFGEAIATVGTLISNNLARITEWAYTTALRVAVNVLINEFQNQVVNWIAGNGNPKFITNWNGFLSDVANKAAGEAIYSLVPQACSGFGPLLRVALLPVPYANTNARCTLNQVVNNTNAFFNRFKYGTWYQTWTAYGAAMQPSNNFFGQLIEDRDIQMAKSMNAQQAANSQAVASKGFLSVTKCVHYDESSGTPVCDQEVDTTPGAVVGETLTTSLGWKGNQIVGAQRFEDLVGAIVNASINRVIKEGLSSLTQAMNPSVPSSAGATPSSITNPASFNSTVNNINNLIAPLDQLGVFTQNNSIINADTQWLALEGQTVSAQAASSTVIGLLKQIVSSCSIAGGSQTASQRINDLNSIASSTISELNTANNLKTVRAAAPTATSTQDIQNIISQLQTVNINQLTAAATAAQTRLDSLQYFSSLVQASLANGDCGVNLYTATPTPPPLIISG